MCEVCIFFFQKGVRSGLFAEQTTYHNWVPDTMTLWILCLKSNWEKKPTILLFPLPYCSLESGYLSLTVAPTSSNTMLKSIAICEVHICVVYPLLRVENLPTEDITLAVSGNFVDESNVQEAARHLRVNALKDPGAGQLLKELVQLRLA